ncbi:hypothetical protein TanjilG_24588 [Lupinus angustifolius]|uniref:Methylcrotonoyl-CoA carboxylase subunit alpha n=1 Tax=Lupinus angustifolius TaxID=3871 RepID=A0A4P1RL24_LUPAN|nr:hypothetical protein TanjilG_24588 [Lupinus angustifolius]
MASMMLLHRKLRISRSFNFHVITRSFSERIEKIVIANRGEIACRIMRTAKRLGIRTVAIYSDADKDSLHVHSADEAIRIGPPLPRFSYLNAPSIVDAAIRSGAQAIHPGYGFLSESADFAQLCEDKGLTFIGPPASAIRDMGDKSASKRIMGAAGVPLVPGYHGSEQDIDKMKFEADKIGYPVLIKPTHGGGGKGMRIVHTPDEFVESFLAAQREAAASFGVNTILLEKYITRPRHIEVQPNISTDFRAHLGQAAVSAAKAVNYYNAGTVEFIVDTVSGQFYFMEMNTRLQVEHPVTEMIVGQDLVEWQIHVANGEALPLNQSQVPISGHAFEARIYAENVPKGFLPATGVLHHYRVPVSPAVRVETGVKEGDTVSMHYDPMIAKLVVHGENRDAALIKLKDCLSKFQTQYLLPLASWVDLVVAGLPTNINFLQKLANHRAFENGNVETHFIDNHKEDLFVDTTNSVSAKEAYAAARLSASFVAACLIEKEHVTLARNTPGGSSLLPVWYASPPFRVHHQAKRTMELEWDNEYGSGSSNVLKLTIIYQPDGRYLIETEKNGSPISEVKATYVEDDHFRVEADGVSNSVNLACYTKEQIRHIHIWQGSSHHYFREKLGLELSEDEDSQYKPKFETSANTPGTAVAPMAGLVVKVLVKNKSKVEEGHPVLVLEAMKMEHVVKAPSSGYVHGLQAIVGEQVSDGSILFSVKVS